MDDTIRGIIRTHTQVDSSPESLTPTADLYAAGMTSQATVNVMLALEDAFDVEFPDHMLKRSVFESIESIHSALAELSGEAAA
jgi:acyl carrier protein